MLLELILTIAVVIGILIFAGVSLTGILNLTVIIIGGILALTVAFVILFFFGTDISLLFFRRAKGRFLRIDDMGRFDHAVYQVDGTEYSCLFPAETIARKRIYEKESVLLMIPRSGKRKVAYDRHSLLIIMFGNLFSLALIAVGLFVWFQYRSI